MSFLREDIAAVWQASDPMQTAFALEGECFRDVPGRRTLRVLINQRAYFVKLHYGVGWAEIMKNWLQFKRPVIGAVNEYETCRDLAEVGVAAPIPAAFAQSGGSIAKRRSFVLCDELAGYTSLEDITDQWQAKPPSAALKRSVLMAVAQFAARYHGYGFIHRDFYICHLLAQDAAWQRGAVELAVLDLHRARRFPAGIPRRWLLRDLAALLYSSLELGYSRRDWWRFVRAYTGRPLNQLSRSDLRFWRSVLERAHRLYRAGVRKGLDRGVYQP